jgi:hypothetical protein
MYLRKLPIVFIFLLVIFLIPKKVFAATITMQNAPTQIGISDEYAMDVTLSISVADNTNYYLRGVFYSPGTSNYCGYTWNGTDWFKGPFSNNGDQKQFYKVVITNHQWVGQLKAKIDAEDNGCAASGTYSFKIERFTDSSNTGTFDTQTEQTVSVVIPTPTPTSTPIPTPTNTPIPPTVTPTPKSPTFTPTPKVATPTTTPKIFQPSSSTAITNVPSTATDEGVLGTDSSAFAFDTPTPSPTKTPSHFAAAHTVNPIPIIFIGAGCCLLAACGILIFLQYKKTGKLW